MARRRNPIPVWLWALPVGAVAVAAVVVARRRSAGDGSIYLYWSELLPRGYKDTYPGYVPHIQREDGTEHVVLDGRLAEAEAERDAINEIERRAGIPRPGRPA
jgi:hypothetical protein